jgi:hypothetical protein
VINCTPPPRFTDCTLVVGLKPHTYLVIFVCTQHNAQKLMCFH